MSVAQTNDCTSEMVEGACKYSNNDSSVPDRTFSSFRVLLGVVLAISILLELVYFPSLPNFYGCAMAVISYVVFFPFCRREYYARYPFSFIVLLPLFMYRFLPLPATLMEWKPVSYGMESPFWTFSGESLLFVDVCLAFYLACPLARKRNGLLSQLFNGIGLYRVPVEAVVWSIGMFGSAVYGYWLFSGVEAGKSGSIGNVLSGFIFLRNAPLVLLFPAIFGGLKFGTKRFYVWGYFSFHLVITIAANSRNMLIAPILLLLFLYALNASMQNVSLVSNLSPMRVLIIGIAAWFIQGAISDMSAAMLYTRKIRSDISKLELISETYKVYADKEYLSYLRKTNNAIAGVKESTYLNGWTEDYLDNFMLNRFCNVRITDIGLHYGSMIDSEGAAQLRKEYFGRLLGLMPSAIIGDAGVKDYFRYSIGDRLYSLALRCDVGLGSRRVISELADGVATFGALFFFFYFILRYVVFLLINSLTYVRADGFVSHSMLGLLFLYELFLGQTNVNGSVTLLYYIFRGFWQNLMIYAIIAGAVAFCLNCFVTRKV